MHIENEIKNPPFLLHASYIAMIEGSVGTRMFQRKYYKIGGRPLDVLFNGNVACVHYISSIQYLFGLVKEPHTKISEALRDMTESGWYQLAEPQPGAVILWGKSISESGVEGDHKHLGFFIDDYRAVSNDSNPHGVIVSHHPTFGYRKDRRPVRPVEGWYWHSKLGNPLSLAGVDQRPTAEELALTM